MSLPGTFLKYGVTLEGDLIANGESPIKVVGFSTGRCEVTTGVPQSQLYTDILLEHQFYNVTSKKNVS
jgi:hypothetical protein